MTETVTFNDMGNKILVSPYNKNQSSVLEKGFYSVGFNPDLGGYFLNKENPFKMPSQIYGSYQSRVDRAIRAFRRREDTNTGVLLEGTKGSGKTIMAKQLCNQMHEMGFPVIVVNSAYAGEGFNRFVEKLGDCVILFDEFEKVYSMKDGQQDSLLTLFDGTINTRNLIILTVNAPGEVAKHFHGRPGRIYLTWSFGKLEREIVQEVLEDLVTKKEDRDAILNYYSFQDHFTFDILMTLIDEIQAESIPFDELIDPLNIRDKYSPAGGGKLRLEISHKKFGREVLSKPTIRVALGTSYLFKIDCYEIASDIKCRPLNQRLETRSAKNVVNLVTTGDGSLTDEVKDEIDDLKEVWEQLEKMDEELGQIEIAFDDLTEIDHESGTMIFEKMGFTVKAEPMVNKNMSMSQFFGR